MSDNAIEAKMRAWFEAHSGSLMLPDGWFGRPYDNRHRMTSLDTLNHTTTLVLDGDLILTFEDILDTVATPNELTIGPFHSLSLASRSGSTKPRTYRVGIARILAPPSA